MIDIESKAIEHIGKLVFAFSQLEENINLSLQWLVKAQDFYTVNPLVERLSFKSKIDALLDIVEIKFKDEPHCISEFKTWHKKIDSFRIKRNSFIHGSWGFTGIGDNVQAVNISPGMSGPKKKKETRYYVSELNKELIKLDELSNEFRRIRKKWHF